MSSWGEIGELIQRRASGDVQPLTRQQLQAIIAFFREQGQEPPARLVMVEERLIQQAEEAQNHFANTR